MAIATSSVLSRKNLIDFTDIPKLAGKFKRMSVAFAPAVKSVKVEFGAYMSYSFFLERGTRKMAARPHIEPTVVKNANAIVTHMVSATLNVVQQMGSITGNSVSNVKIKSTYEKAWLQILNGKLRPEAVALGRQLKVFELGFHLRSIAGYVRERSVAEIKAEQTAAASQRKKKISGN